MAMTKLGSNAKNALIATLALVQLDAVLRCHRQKTAQKKMMVSHHGPSVTRVFAASGGTNSSVHLTNKNVMIVCHLAGFPKP